MGWYSPRGKFIAFDHTSSHSIQRREILCWGWGGEVSAYVSLSRIVTFRRIFHLNSLVFCSVVEEGKRDLEMEIE
jgi:hypothetical protein